MTNTERFFINIVSSYISGKKPQTPDGIDYSELLLLAHIHKLLPVVYSSLKTNFNDGETVNFINKIKKAAIAQVAGQAVKCKKFMEVCSAINEKSIKYASLKGTVLGSLYPEPDLRLSSDEDILATGADFDKAAAVLIEAGFEMRESENGESNVSPFYDKDSGLLIELHRSLFSDRFLIGQKMCGFYDGAAERYESIYIDNCKISILSPTDALLYLILHSFKHFIRCGFGIRQITDFILFAKSKAGSTNAEYIISSLKEVNALGFFDCILKICEEYFDASKDDLGFSSYTPSETDPSNMIADVISGGAYGNSSPERVHSSLITLLSVESGKKESFISALFPPYDIMKTKYPIVARSRLFLPLGWTKRIITKLLRRKKSFDTSETVEIGKRRVAMLKEYGVIE